MKHPLAHKVQKPTRYVPALTSDIRKTFARLKREQAERAKQEQPQWRHS